MSNQFRQKNPMVTAMKVTKDNLKEVAKWCGGYIGVHIVSGEPCAVRFWDGLRDNYVNVGEWLVMSSDGRLQPMTDDQFKKVYEPA